MRIEERGEKEVLGGGSSKKREGERKRGINNNVRAIPFNLQFQQKNGRATANRPVSARQSPVNPAFLLAETRGILRLSHFT